MTENPNPQSRPAPEDLHWGISYLRGDIQDLRNQIGVVHQRIDESNKRMDSHFMWTMTTLVAITGILIAVIKL